MQTQPLKVLTNVLISLAENRLQLVDVYFNSKIRRIEPMLEAAIEWNDIAEVEQWNRFQQEIPAQKFPPRLKIYDGKFMLLSPGAIDTHVHFNTPGFEHRETFESGSLAAAHGGVTTVVDMPCTSIPPVTTVENLKTKQQAIRGRSWIDYAFWGGVAGNDFDRHRNISRQIEGLAGSGIIGFKSYLISGMSTFHDLPFEKMLFVADCAKRTGKPLAVHAEDKLSILFKQYRYRIMWQHNWRAYCETRDDIAEAKAVAKMSAIARKTGCQIHIVHLSSELGLEQVRRAQLEGLRFTAETCPHYLFFTQKDFENESVANFLKTAPPVKMASDREALWEGLADGTISFVTTDHAGCDPIKEKSSWNFWEVYGGIPGVEHRVPFLFSEGFKKGRLTLEETIKLLATNPAIFADLHHKGSLEVDNDADMTLVNLWDSQIIKAENMFCKGKYTPFEGVAFSACVEATFLRGKLIANRAGESEVEVGYGKFIGD